MVSDSSARPTLLIRTWKALGSVRLAVVLIVTLAVVLAWTTILESIHGREYAQWFVYGSQWFVALLALLGLNILVATLHRFPWKKRLPFLVTHAGLLILLFGSIQTFMSGIDGQLSIAEGESASSLTIPSQTRFTVVWPERNESRAAAFVFQPGPVDWPEGKTLDLGELNGVRLRMLRYLRHARVDQAWVQDNSPDGTPVLQFALHGPDGSRLQEHWLAAEQFGGTVSMGPATFEFQRLAADTMVDDFLNPLTEDLGETGILSIHHEGKIKRISVEDHLGQKVPLDDGEISIEIKEYLPNATPAGNAQFTSEGEVAANPMLEILVHGSENTEPTRQIAFAKHPLLNFDGIHGWTSPVKFWFHHQASAPDASTEFVQAPNGKLYCRTAVDGEFTPHGQIGLEQSIPTAAGFSVSILEHIPSARQRVTYHSVPGGKNAEAAALLEVQAGGVTEEIWMQRQDSQLGFSTISTQEGPVSVAFGYEQVPLLFSIELLEFTRDKNPGGMMDSSYRSQVRLIDAREGIDEESEISMNAPLTYGKFTLYQSSYRDLPSGKEASILTVAYDPGRFLKYVGCLMICVGSFAMFYTRALGSGRLSGLSQTTCVTQPRSQAMRQVATIITLLVATNSLANPASADESTYDWDQWSRLAVQDGGRCKPLDSLAWETLRIIANRGDFDDPETSEKLSPVAVYMTMVFDWQGWETAEGESSDPHARHGTGVASYYQGHEADRWDRSEFIRIDSPALREMLGFPLDKRHFSPLAIGEAAVVDPSTGKTTPFVRWAMQLLKKRDEGLTPVETEALETADKLWSYQDHRMGRRLRLLPIPGSKDQEWLSWNQLMQASLDDSLDPTGDLRQAQGQAATVRTVYLKGDVGEFNRASRQLITQLATLGPQLGSYPEQGMTDMEVAYNHWAPFRYAWILTMFAFLAALLAMGTEWKVFYRGAILLHVCGLVAMCIGFGMRMALSGRAPVTNMYESVIYVGLGIAVLGLILEMIYRKGYILTAAAATATVALVLADNCSVLLDPSLRPLQPVLRNNFWLVIHVMSITLSYGAFALALGIANITLGYFLAGSKNQEAISALNNFTYRTLQVGVLLLAAGTILGGVWADYAWGRFWGWDPKEVWALVALLGYLALLHARYAGWIGQFGLAAWSAFCFSLVVVAWYGVNYVLGAGLHSYGSGDGGREYVAAALLLQFVYIAIAGLRYSQTTPGGGRQQPSSASNDPKTPTTAQIRGEETASV